MNGIILIVITYILLIEFKAIENSVKMLTVIPVPALSDNYMYVLTDEERTAAAVVDPILNVLKQNNLTLTHVLVTHHHSDHAGGNEELSNILHSEGLSRVKFIGGDDRIPCLNEKVVHGQELKIGEINVLCMHTPCHTRGHICYYVTDKKDDKVVFTGDTLFIGGCGKFFEGTGRDMYEALINRLGNLPNDTKVYCGHEYTLSNLKFALSVEPENPDLKNYMETVQKQLDEGKFTVPSLIGNEKKFNPFMRVMVMSERENTPTKRVLCRYYMNGFCRHGQDCTFSHNRTDAPSMVCRYFVRGNCTYGSRCRYDHVRPSWMLRNLENIGFPVVNETAAKPNSDVEAATVQLSSLRVDAPEFVPSSGVSSSASSRTYAEVVGKDETTDKDNVKKQVLCGYNVIGTCPFGEKCTYVHGDVCDLCQRAILIPGDEAYNSTHRQECMAEHEKEMEVAFTIARSSDKQCGICMETVMEKADESNRSFGILPNCKHCFCLQCIRQWRGTNEFDLKNTRACPECRVMSDFVVPSSFWVETAEERACLIDSYKSSLKQRRCKYYVHGQRECQFGNKCFYRHEDPEGRLVEGDSPRTIRRRMRRMNRNRRRQSNHFRRDFIYLGRFMEAAIVNDDITEALNDILDESGGEDYFPSDSDDDYYTWLHPEWHTCRIQQHALLFESELIASTTSSTTTTLDEEGVATAAAAAAVAVSRFTNGDPVVVMGDDSRIGCLMEAAPRPTSDDGMFGDGGTGRRFFGEISCDAADLGDGQPSFDGAIMCATDSVATDETKQN
ncbi:putative E3 ubiquitin-protein ligase makorin-1 [Trichinella zimbabwensis]|uniref:RING-type E3 ubiquitin transferase n=1 Tax=Trichinella zimbabwensis TaxID=268475 RepID=A0A0V1H8F3_9BILA|nr:putative E3 ubiquitin-protein ligase makorin-1 [Trichinella zimbabwensis]